MSEITKTYVVVSPQMAQSWLSNAAPNRPLDKRHVDDFVKSMQNGRFVKESASIKFNQKGQVADGQHKLNAVVQFGNPVEMEVWHNVNELVLEDVDSLQKPRSLADSLTIYHSNNVQYPQDTSSIVRRIECVRQRRTTVKLSTKEAFDLYNKNQDAIDYVANVLGNSKHSEFIMVGVKSGLVIAWKKNPTIIKVFIDEYLKGGPIDSTNPAHVLNRTMQSNLEGIRNKVSLSVTKTLQAINCFLKNETTTRIRTLSADSCDKLHKNFLQAYDS